MHDILRHFPYNAKGYDNKFINKDVINVIRTYCEEEKHIIKGFYAKGSLIHGCMILGSDIDHVRIQTRIELCRGEKKDLVDELESRLIKVGVSDMKRIRDSSYARVFYIWDELKKFPNALTTDYPIYPYLRVITARNKKDWFRKVIKTAYNYTNNLPEYWRQRMAERILECNMISEKNILT